MAVKIAVEMAVETAARRTKPAFAGSPQPTSQSATADFVWIAAISIARANRSHQPTSQSATADFVWIAAISIAGVNRNHQPTSQSATADFVWIAAISIAGADRILNKSRDRPWIVTAASKCL
jgi:hypothetical protein